MGGWERRGPDPVQMSLSLKTRSQNRVFPAISPSLPLIAPAHPGIIDDSVSPPHCSMGKLRHREGLCLSLGRRIESGGRSTQEAPRCSSRRPSLVGGLQAREPMSGPHRGRCLSIKSRQPQGAGARGRGQTPSLLPFKAQPRLSLPVPAGSLLRAGGATGGCRESDGLGRVCELV